MDIQVVSELKSTPQSLKTWFKEKKLKTLDKHMFGDPLFVRYSALILKKFLYKYFSRIWLELDAVIWGNNALI